MAETPSDADLTGLFPAASREAWLRLVNQVLKGAAFDRLVAKTLDGIAIEPLYGPAPGLPPAPRAVHGRWEVLGRVDHPEPAEAAALARAEIEHGAAGLHVVFAGAVGACGFGLAEASAAAIETLFEQIDLRPGMPIAFDLGWREPAVMADMAGAIAAKGVDPASVRFGLDPLGAAALAGGAGLSWTACAPRFAAAVKELVARGFGGPVCIADGRIIHGAGGSEAQELAFVLAAALAYLRALEAAGIPLAEARSLVGFRFAADADQLLTMAKFRAARRLWARIEAVCGLTPAPVHIHAETAWRTMTRRDPYVNILRATVAVAAAALGGADAISVLPFTQALGLPDGFARRLARNTQLILLEEAHLAKVDDPAAGSGAVEALTEALGQAAWGLFQEIERAGGLGAALERGLLQAKVEAARRQRERNIAFRVDRLIGTSDFPDLAEQPVNVIMRSAPPSARPERPMIALPALAPMRLAEPFERLRDLSDARLAKEGARPRVFLANLGRPADFTTRANFAKSFFEVGGIAAIGNEGFADAASLVAAFKAAGARLACLCAGDATYAAQGADAARALRAAGASRVFLAGQPDGQEAVLRQAGIADFVHDGCNALAILEDAQAAA